MHRSDRRPEFRDWLETRGTSDIAHKCTGNTRNSAPECLSMSSGGSANTRHWRSRLCLRLRRFLAASWHCRRGAVASAGGVSFPQPRRPAELREEAGPGRHRRCDVPLEPKSELYGAAVPFGSYILWRETRSSISCRCCGAPLWTGSMVRAIVVKTRLSVCF
jgi:hypothetical protein